MAGRGTLKQHICRMPFVFCVVWHFCSSSLKCIVILMCRGLLLMRTCLRITGKQLVNTGQIWKKMTLILLSNCCLWRLAYVWIVDVYLFFTLRHVTEKVTFSWCHMCFSERHFPSVLSQTPLAGWAPSDCHWQSTERRVSYCVCTGPAWTK